MSDNRRVVLELVMPDSQVQQMQADIGQGIGFPVSHSWVQAVRVDPTIHVVSLHDGKGNYETTFDAYDMSRYDALKVLSGLIARLLSVGHPDVTVERTEQTSPQGPTRPADPAQAAAAE